MGNDEWDSGPRVQTTDGTALGNGRFPPWPTVDVVTREPGKAISHNSFSITASHKAFVTALHNSTHLERLRAVNSAGLFLCIILVQKGTANSALQGIDLKPPIDEPTGQA
jgi:hypothetical protein